MKKIRRRYINEEDKLREQFTEFLTEIPEFKRFLAELQFSHPIGEIHTTTSKVMRLYKDYIKRLRTDYHNPKFISLYLNGCILPKRPRMTNDDKYALIFLIYLNSKGKIIYK